MKRKLYYWIGFGLCLLKHIHHTEAEEFLSNELVTLPGPTQPYEVESKDVDCIDLVKEDSDITFSQQKASGTLCGTFLVGGVNDVIHVEIINTNIKCDEGEFIEIFDGWISRGEILPNEEDHEAAVSDRIVEYCDWLKNGNHGYFWATSSQNIALVQYRLLPNSFLTFRFRRLQKNSPSCHVISPIQEGTYIMRSFGKRNCTFSMIQPTRLVVNEIQVGNTKRLGKNQTFDTIEILNGESLDTSSLNIVHTYTSPLISKESTSFDLDKGHTAVRMTSSGVHSNLIKFQFSRMTSDLFEDDEC